MIEDGKFKEARKGAQGYRKEGLPPPKDGLDLRLVRKPPGNPKKRGPYKPPQSTPAFRTPENAAIFLAALASHGNRTKAALAIGQRSRTALYKWRQEDPEFAAAWKEAYDLGIDAMEDEAKKRAMRDSDLLMIFMLKAARPEVYRERGFTNNVNVNFDLRNTPIEDLRAELSELMQREPDIGRRPTVEVVGYDDDVEEMPEE